MKNLKKLILALVVVAFGAMMVGCKNDNGNNNNNGGNGGNGGNTNKKVYLTYAEWGDATVAQAMLDAFMAEHQNIVVTLDTSISGSGTAFTQNLVQAAQANMLPDVFVTDNVPTVIENGLVRDVSEYWDKDDDAQKVYSNIASAATYYNPKTGKNVRLAVPSYQFVKGFFVNKTLLQNLGIDAPEYDWTFEEFYNICKQVKNTGTYGGKQIFALNGYYGVADFEKAMTAQSGEGYGYDAWNGTAFNYECASWKLYREYTREFYDTGLLEQLTPEEKQAQYGSTDAWPFREGDTAFAVEGSWNFGNMLAGFKSSGLDVEVYPYPAGKEAHQASILDFMCVSSLTDFPEEAYELAKWMSFGQDGWKKRIEIMSQSGQAIDRFPVADYPEVWEKITEYMTKLSENNNYEGYIYCIENLKNAAPDCDKWLPGYSDFWNYVADTNEENDWYNKGTDQLAKEWTELINQKVQEAYAKLGLEPAKK